MANTLIQIKRSLTTSQPTSLSVAELGYSYQSNTVFIGTPDGTGTIAIGGKRYLDLINLSFNVANAAYGAANGAGSLAVINLLFQTANAGFDKGNAAYTVANSAYDFANNTYSNYAYPAYAWSSAGFDVANAAFGKVNTLATSANSYATAVGAAGNAYATSVGTSGNAYAVAIGTAGNAYTVVVGAAGNAYANVVGTAGNTYAAAVGVAANTYANNTFVKLTAGSQTITGDLAVTGNLTFLGNSTVISSSQLNVGDSLIYLAANNYSGTDLVDIGFIANYGNTTGANVHTGLVRDATDKTYYLFNGYDKEPANNTFVPYGNNMTLAVLNADLITSNLTLGGANAIVWIGAAFDKANAANVLAYNTGIGANAYADSVGVAANVYAAAVGVSANAYATSVGASGNNWANATFSVIGHNHAGIYAAANQAGVIANAAFAKANSANVLAYNTGIGANAYANTVGTSGNAYTDVVGAASNTWANTLNTIIFQTFSDAANISSGTLSSSRLSGSYTGITGLGTITTGTWNGSTVNVGYGGTGIVSATLNGVLFGGGGNAAFQVTSAGTEGQVLMASATGIPQFEMISGGTF